MRPVLALLILSAGAARGDPPEVLAVEAVATGGGWRFDVTLDHPDTGWDHYADGWRLELPDGTVIGERPLAHPHVTEMPFTRSLSGVALPADVTQVRIRARCNLDGWAAETASYDLPGG